MARVHDENKVSRVRHALRTEMEYLDGRDAPGDRVVSGAIRSYVRLARDESLIRFYDILTKNHGTGGRNYG